MEPKPDEFVNLLSWGWEKNVMEHFTPAVMMSASRNLSAVNPGGGHGQENSRGLDREVASRLRSSGIPRRKYVSRFVGPGASWNIGGRDGGIQIFQCGKGDGI
jgi:hypothetical protein